MSAPRVADSRGREARVHLSAAWPNIDLHHGEAIWVMAQLGFCGNASKTTFNEHVKSLRKLGIPFARHRIDLVRRAVLNYSYCRLMELALACKLHVYHAVPDSVLGYLVVSSNIGSDPIDSFVRLTSDD